METITLINGNGQPYTRGLPKLIFRTDYINDVALQHIYENTGLNFVKNGWGYEAQPITSMQIVALFMTYNFKTKHYDNWQYENTIILKSDHHIGFDVDSICYDCVKENHITVNGLNPGDRLAC